MTSAGLPITLAVFAKNNQDSIWLCLNSVSHLVSEIILVDTGSTDDTVKIATELGARVYKVGFTDFGSIRTLTAHLATQPWILGLDTDEILAPEELSILIDLMDDAECVAWGLPRRRWRDIGRTIQVEQDAYPDWQYRFIRNNPGSITYENRVHEGLNIKEGNIRTSEKGPHIEHFQDVFKSDQRLQDRNELYRGLYEQDVADGVERAIPAVANIDMK